MRLCFIADARSPIAQNWIGHFVDLGHDVYVISSYPCEPDLIPGTHFETVLFGLTQLSRIRHDGAVVSGSTNSQAESAQPAKKSITKTTLAQLRNGQFKFLARFVTNWLVPVDLYWQRNQLKAAIERIQPDIVHAMRISREGIAAAYATPEHIPLVLSVWGNDFTLWAINNPLRGHQTRMALQRMDGLFSDCHRDIRLAKEWGLEDTTPILVVPGAGGLDITKFVPDGESTAIREKYDIPADAVLLINPRGIRNYVRNDVFFKALPKVIDACPDAYFLCIDMQGNAVVDQWIGHDNVREKVRLLPKMPHSEMANLYRAADISVSPSEHDGTPNSLLEAMASGCFVVAGNIESVAEWITHGQNGLLYDPTDSDALAEALIKAIQDADMRTRGAKMSREIIEQRADQKAVIPQAEAFYETVLAMHRETIS
ncbi:MAG: glycosyltransferase [Anaerolineae bacterium]|nr:glycosyltransferase [Anaerolineae bacterium]